MLNHCWAISNCPRFSSYPNCRLCTNTHRNRLFFRYWRSVITGTKFFLVFFHLILILISNIFLLVLLNFCFFYTTESTYMFYFVSILYIIRWLRRMKSNWGRNSANESTCTADEVLRFNSFSFLFFPFLPDFQKKLLFFLWIEPNRKLLRRPLRRKSSSNQTTSTDFRPGDTHVCAILL